MKISRTPNAMPLSRIWDNIGLFLCTIHRYVLSVYTFGNFGEKAATYPQDYTVQRKSHEFYRYHGKNNWSHWNTKPLSCAKIDKCQQNWQLKYIYLWKKSGQNNILKKTCPTITFLSPVHPYEQIWNVLWHNLFIRTSNRSHTCNYPWYSDFPAMSTLKVGWLSYWFSGNYNLENVLTFESMNEYTAISFVVALTTAKLTKTKWWIILH